MTQIEKKELLPPYLHGGYEQTGSYADEDESDRKVIGQLVEMGVDLAKARHAIYYLYFPTEETARSASEELRELQFAVAMGERVESEPAARQWPVSAERTEVVNLDTIRDLRAPLHAIAQRHGGEYDGWEAAASDD